MSEATGTGFRPWQRPVPTDTNGKTAHAASKPEVSEEEGEGPRQQRVKEVVADVLDGTHRAVNEQRQVSITLERLREQVQAAQTVKVERNTLLVGGKTYPIDPTHLAGLTLLQAQQQVFLGVADAVRSGAPALVSVADGVDAGAAARAFLEATGARYRYRRISHMTTMDALAGQLRPDASGTLRVQHGPLTECIMHGGVFVAEGIEQAEKDVLAMLAGLAKGVKEFHHPVSGRMVPVHPDFRLVLITNNRARYSGELVSACALTEAASYTRDDHMRLLIEQCGISPAMASMLAQAHDKIAQRQVSDKPEEQIDFGRQFPISWPLLARVAKRLKQLADPQVTDVSDAFFGVYGARLATPSSVAAFNGALAAAGLPPPRTYVYPATEKFVPMGKQGEALAQAVAAHRAGEAVMFSAPSQSGVTTMVNELGRAFNQEVVTVTCHPGTDPQSLVERLVFKEDGSVEYVPGVVTDALLHGKLLYIDHLDHMPADRQEALIRLVEQKTIQVLQNGQMVEVPVHPDARIYFSTTTGSHRSRQAAPARERALVTEIRMEGPTLDDAFALLPPGLVPELRAEMERVARELHADAPGLGLMKLQRFRDFAGSAALLAQHVSAQDAVAYAAHMLFDEKRSAALARLPKPADGTPPLWMRVMDLTDAQVQERVARTSYHLVPSMRDYLLPLAVAHKLGRPVLTVGPAAAGKTVLGIVWAAIADKKVTRFNFSASTEASSLYGGLGPVNIDGQVRFLPVKGSVVRAMLDDRGAWIGDERNLSTEAMMSMKPLLDFRRAVIDPETGLPQSIGSSILYFAENPMGTRGRQEQPPVVDDCMFRIVVRSKPVEERADIVASQCGLPRQWKTSVSGRLTGASFDPVLSIASFFDDLDVMWHDHRDKIGPTEGPVTCTERDMLQVASRVEYLIARDGISDPHAQRRLLGREVFRTVRGLVKTAEGSDFVFEKLVKKHFGSDIPAIARPTKIEHITAPDGTLMVQIGTARRAVRDLEEARQVSYKIEVALGIRDPAKEPGPRPGPPTLVPTKDRLGEPVGAQLEFLEDVLLALETDQPVAIVGITGSGKTMLVRLLAHHLNEPLLEEAYHSDMSEEHIFGSTVLTAKGEVKFQESRLDLAAQFGAWYVGDELLTLPNQTRESLNPVTEGSEIQIPSRPTRTLSKKGGPAEDRWHGAFRQIYTTNGDDIRADGFSDPEASRLSIIGIREPRGFAELNEIAQRDYGVQTNPTLTPSPSRFTASDRSAARNEVLGLMPSKSAFVEAFKLACVDAAPASGVKGFLSRLVGGGAGRNEEALSRQTERAFGAVPVLDLSAEQESAIATALWQFKGEGFSGARELLSALVVAAKDPQSASRIAGMVPPGSLSTAALERANAHAVSGNRLTSPIEIARLVELFDELRNLQGGRGSSPLTARLLSSFLELYIEMRRSSGIASAAIRAAEMTLLSKLPPDLEAQGIAKVVEACGKHDAVSADLLVPRQEVDGVWFGDTKVTLGSETPWRPSNERFPLTPARVQNLASIADSDALGRGRPVSLCDDANGESLETLREYARLVGKRLVVVSLTPNTDISQLIEKMVLTDDPSVVGGFTPEEQEIAQAVRDGHLLVLRGCGSVPSSKIERLNSLGDGRNYLDLPCSARRLTLHPAFRMFMLRKPGAPFGYSPALENRLLTPLLSTQAKAVTQEVLSRGASELLENIQHRTQISVESARLLARFHVCLNELLRKGEFASSMTIGSFLNRDAEAVARRLKHLTVQGAVSDEMETLHRVVVELYGERFDNESDRSLFASLAKRFICDRMAAAGSNDVSASQHFVRFGEWSVPRDSRGERQGVPESTLPRINGLDALQSKVFAAAQFGETLQIHGDVLVGRAAVQSLAHLTASEVIEVEGNEELSESSLLGGLVQNDDGKFERYEGLVWRAQREGGILLIRNAARLPRDLLMRLAEIAATDNVERVINGRLEIQQKRLRLVLQTTHGDPPLPPELAAACTRVRAEAVTLRPDLVTLTSHVLDGVPGGSAMAAAFVDLIGAADAAIAGSSMQGRQEIRFNGQRLLFLAGDVARELKNPSANVEEVVGAAIARHVLTPVSGLAGAQGVADAVELCLKQLYGTSGVLTAQRSKTIDVIANPHLAALKEDYDKVSGSLTATLLTGLSEAVESSVAKNDTFGLRMLLTSLPLDGLLPFAIERACQAVTATSDNKAGVSAATKKALGELRKAINESVLATPTLEADALEFMRGARLWDLEHRGELLRRYGNALAMCAERGSELAAVNAAQVAGVRERFDAVASETAVANVRESVEAALGAYRRQSGGSDNVLQERFERVVERWDQVTGTSLFKNHHQLRRRLDELHTALDALRDAHDQRGAPRDEVSGLLAALRSADSVLEGLRIAEQSADLRRDVYDAQRGTRELVDDFVDKLGQVKVLKDTKEEHAGLTRIGQFGIELGHSELFKLPSGRVEVEPPARRSPQELREEAARRAEVACRKTLEEGRAALFAQLAEATLRSKAPAPEAFFARYDLEQADVGLSFPRPERPNKTQEAYEEALAKLEAEHEREVAELSKTILKGLALEEAERVEQQYRERVLAGIERVATRTAQVGLSLSRDLRSLQDQLGGVVDEPTRVALEAARAALRKAESDARDWGDSYRRKSGFKLFGREEQEPVHVERWFTPPDRSAVCAAVKAALEAVATCIQGRLGALPDVTRFEELSVRCSAIEDALASADTLGMLSSRYATLGVAAKQTVAVGGALQATLARLAPDATTRSLLSHVASFSDLADDLSSRLATKSGLPFGVASAVEATMRAAQVIRQQPVRDKSPRACITALDQVLQRCNEVKPSEATREIVQKLTGEASDLRRDFLGTQATAKSVTLQDAGMDALFDVLRMNTTDASSAESIRAALGGVRAIDAITAPVTSSTPALMRVVQAVVVEVVQARDTELRLIDLEACGLTATEDAASRSNDGKAQGRVNGAVAQIRDRAITAADRLTAGHKTLNAALGRLEEQSKGATLERAHEALEHACKALDELVSDVDPGYDVLRGRVDGAVAALRNAAAIVEPSEIFPLPLLTQLREAAGSVQALELTFDKKALANDVVRVAMQAHAQVAEVRDATRDLASKQGTAGAAASDVTRLAQLADIIAGLTYDGDLLTIWSRRALLQSVAARLALLAEVSAPSLRDSAAELAAKAREAADGLAVRAPSSLGERCLAEAAASFADLGQHLASRTSLTDEQAEQFAALGEVMDRLCFTTSLPRDKAFALATEAAQKVYPLAGLGGSATAGAARDLEAHLKAFQTQANNDDLLRLTDSYASGIGPYFKDRQLAGARVAAAREALLAYDPSRDASVRQLGDALVAAVRDAMALAVGPHAGRIGAVVASTLETLKAGRERVGLGPELERVVGELESQRKSAEKHAASAPIADLFDRMCVKLREHLDRLATDKAGPQAMQHARTVIDAVLELRTVDAGSIQKKVKRVAERYFAGDTAGLTLPELVQLRAPTTPAPTVFAPSAGTGSSGTGGAATGSSGSGPVGVGVSAGTGDGGPAPLGQGVTSGPPLSPEEQLAAPTEKPTDEIASPHGPIAQPPANGRGIVDIIEVSESDIQKTLTDMQAALEERRRVDAPVEKAAAPRNAFEQFVADNQSLVQGLRQIFRQFPCEVVVVVDQSGSTEGEVIRHEQAIVGLVLGTQLGSEGNCSIVGTGSKVGVGSCIPGTDTGGQQAWLHKAMKAPMTPDSADAAFRLCGNAAGGTDLIPAINAGAGQFTTKSNNKLILCLTDAQVPDPADIRNLIDGLRAQGVGFAMIGLGAANNVETVAGEFGIHVKSFREAIEGAAALLTKCLVSNQGRFQGKVQGTAAGVGTAILDLPLSGAGSTGPMQSSLRMSQSITVGPDPNEVYGAAGDARELQMLATRNVYEAARKNLELAQNKARHSASFRQCRQQVVELAAKHQRDGTAARLRDAAAMSLPRAGGTQMLRKQLSGSLFDEQQLPLYVAGLAQGMPVMRIFKKKKGSEELRAQVVLAIDESSSMGDTDKARANIEAMLAYGDALKAIDDKIQIAVVGYSDKVRLHAGFDQTWDDDLKAHLLHQIRCEGDATDDERGVAEAGSLLDMIEADIGQIMVFGDGQGLPGTQKVIQQQVGKGYNVIVTGIGPECKGVLQFADHALYARNLQQFVHQYPNVALRAWERANRLVGRA